MDESLARASVDLVRRQHSHVSLKVTGERVEGMPREDLEHFFSSLLKAMACCAHVDVLRGTNEHHKAEAAIKSLALSFRQAAAPDARTRRAAKLKGHDVTMAIAVLDYGAGNLFSIRNALERAGVTVDTVTEPARRGAHDGIVLPWRGQL